ncbi:MAG: thioredoxin 2 [Chloroflexota bacterium]|jgi:thioredoxin 2|nr:thioredoxin 2 [Chloroflexota bacterium]
MSDPGSQIIVCPDCGRKNRVPDAAPGKPSCAICHSPLPWSVTAGDDTFDRVAAGSDLPVLVDLWAPWCGPCTVVSPLVERASQAFAGRLKVVKVNVDEAPGVASRFGARGIPTLLLLDHGRELSRQVGAVPWQQLERWIQSTLSTLPAGRS